MTVSSPLASRNLYALLDLRPEDRSALLRTLPPEELGPILIASEDELGSRWGLWVDDPVGFVEIGLSETLWSVQKRILRSVEANERTAVPSCHGAGKSHLAARAVAWWIAVNPPGTAVAVTTADKWRKVRRNLWPHIRHVHASGRLPGICLQTEWAIDGAPVAFGFSPADHDEDAFSGIHAPKVLVLVDEAGSMSATLGQSIESLMSAGHVRMLLIGNPPIDEVGSPWFEERCLSPHYETVELPTSSTPNFTGEETDLCRVHPHLAAHPISDHLPTLRSVEVVRDDYGEGSAYFVARILAKFPKDVVSKTIPRSWIDDAVENDDPESSDWIRLGVDVAADGGDELVIARAEGFVVRIVHTSSGSTNENPVDVAGKILEAILEAETFAKAIGSTRKVRVKIDALGLGWGVAGTLKAWGTEGRHHADVVPVKVSERASTKENQGRFSNKRAEMWWNGRELLRPRGEGKDREEPTVRLEVDDRTVRQLAAPSYHHDSGGRILIEKKDDLAKRGVGSPDRAEGVLLALYEPEPSHRAKVRRSGGGTLPSPTRGG